MKEEGFGQARGILLAKSDGCSVYQFRNETGDGTMTCYEVFPGAMLSFNDFHVKYFDSEYVPGRNMFVIDHCREGKMEYLAVENAYAYVGAGDIKMDRRLTHTGRFVFPSSHYHGLTIGFDMEIAAAALAEEVKDFPVDLIKLQEKYCPGRYPNLIHKKVPQSIFSGNCIRCRKRSGSLILRSRSWSFCCIWTHWNCRRNRKKDPITIKHR